MNDEEQRKKIAMMIADLIQELLYDSVDLTEILEEARDDGYDIFLTVFSGIMIRRRDEEEEDAHPLPIKFEFTEFDKEFLQSIGIRPPKEKVDDSSDAVNLEWDPPDDVAQ